MIADQVPHPDELVDECRVALPSSEAIQEAYDGYKTFNRRASIYRTLAFAAWGTLAALMLYEPATLMWGAGPLFLSLLFLMLYVDAEHDATRILSRAGMTACYLSGLLDGGAPFLEDDE